MHGLIAVPRYNPWCDREDQILQESVARGAQDAEIARALIESGFTRTPNGVSYRRRTALRIVRPNPTHADPRARRVILEKVRLGWSNRDIASHIAGLFGRSFSAESVRAQRRQLGIPSRSTRNWSKPEQQIVFDHFGKRFSQISNILADRGFSRSSHAVEGFCRRSGLIEYGDKEPAEPLMKKQDAKFCAAMRAAPECPAQYRAERWP